MKPEKNVFGRRICDLKDCPMWFESEEYGCFCVARMDIRGSTGLKDGKVQYGVLCKLPIGFKIVREDE